MNKKERVFKDAARYLGYQKQRIEQGALDLLNQAYDELLAIIQPKHILHEYPVRVDEDLFIIGDMEPVESKNLSHLFAGATKGYALLATLGTPLDMRIKRLMVSYPALGAALSSCASAYIDEYIDEFLSETKEKQSSIGMMLSPRFSPGYGDVPLSYQKPLLALLEARRIGVTLTDGFLMLPEKTVSAIIAVKKIDASEKYKIEKCETCNLITCSYRKKE